MRGLHGRWGWDVGISSLVPEFSDHFLHFDIIIKELLGNSSVGVLWDGKL